MFGSGLPTRSKGRIRRPDDGLDWSRDVFERDLLRHGDNAPVRLSRVGRPRYRQEVFQVRSLRAHFEHGVDYGEYIRDLVACRPRVSAVPAPSLQGATRSWVELPAISSYDVLTL